MAKTDSVHQQRMRAIEALLLWEGEVGNARIRQLYEVSLVRASQIIATYRRLNPDGLIWDSQRRVYRRATRFRPLFPRSGMDDYDQLLFGHRQAFVVDARIDFTATDPATFSAVYRACADGHGLAVTYRSMSHPEGSERVIYPHHLVRIGRRWHVRAWCAQRRAFVDFAVGRIVSASAVDGPAPVPAAEDHDWERTVMLHVVAHHQLMPAQAAVIRSEYFGGAAAREVPCRACLARYVVQDLRAATTPEQRPPEFQLEVANAAEHAAILFGGGPGTAK